MDEFVFVVAEGTDYSNSKKNKIYACDINVVMTDVDRFDDFTHNNPFWEAVWSDLFGITPLTVPVIETTDYSEIQQSLNFVVTFMHQDPYETLCYINRVWIFRESDSSSDSLSSQFFDLQLS